MVLNLSGNPEEILKIAISNYPLSTKIEQLYSINKSGDILTKEIRVLIDKGFIVEWKEASKEDTTITAFILSPECALFLKGDYSTKSSNVREINDFFRKEFDVICKNNVEKLQQKEVDKGMIDKRYNPILFIEFFLLLFLLLSSRTYYGQVQSYAIFRILLIILLSLTTTIYLKEKAKSRVYTETPKQVLSSYFYAVAYYLDKFITDRTATKNINNAKKSLVILKNLFDGRRGSEYFGEKINELFVKRGFDCDLKISKLLELLTVTINEFCIKIDRNIEDITLIPISYQLKKIAKYVEDENFIAGSAFLEKELGVKIEKEKILKETLSEWLIKYSIPKWLVAVLIIVLIHLLVIGILIYLNFIDTQLKISITECLLSIGVAIVDFITLYKIIIKRI